MLLVQTPVHDTTFFVVVVDKQMNLSFVFLNTRLVIGDIFDTAPKWQ